MPNMFRMQSNALQTIMKTSDAVFDLAMHTYIPACIALHTLLNL